MFVIIFLKMIELDTCVSSKWAKDQQLTDLREFLKHVVSAPKIRIDLCHLTDYEPGHLLKVKMKIFHS
jgi:hypothetical protein